MQPKALAGEVFPDTRHPEIGAVLAPELLRQRVSEVTCCVRPATHFPQQLLPFFAGQPTSIPVRARMLPPMIKKADVVILRFQRLDLSRDKVIEHHKVVLNRLRYVKEKRVGHRYLARAV